MIFMINKDITKNDAVTSILFCGIGGQGVLKASEICAVALMYEGFHVKKSEVHGMSQRGGSVDSHLRFGEHVDSPLIPYGQTDILVPFEKNEAKRFKGQLKKSGVDLSEYLVAAGSFAPETRFLNTFMLGVLSRSIKISTKNWSRAFEELLPKKLLEDNLRIFDVGKECVL